MVLRGEGVVGVGWLLLLLWRRLLLVSIGRLLVHGDRVTHAQYGHDVPHLHSLGCVSEVGQVDPDGCERVVCAFGQGLSVGPRARRGRFGLEDVAVDVAVRQRVGDDVERLSREEGGDAGQHHVAALVLVGAHLERLLCLFGQPRLHVAPARVALAELGVAGCPRPPSLRLPLCDGLLVLPLLRIGVQLVLEPAGDVAGQNWLPAHRVKRALDAEVDWDAVGADDLGVDDAVVDVFGAHVAAMDDHRVLGCHDVQLLPSLRACHTGSGKARSSLS